MTCDGDDCEYHLLFQDVMMKTKTLDEILTTAKETDLI